MAITTIKIKKETKSRMDKLREHPRETYDDLIKKMLWILNTSKINPETAQENMQRIDKIRQFHEKKKGGLNEPTGSKE